MSKTIKAEPNSNGLYKIFRNSGYNFHTACFEFVDNSFHRNVNCTFHDTSVICDPISKDPIKICFADDGNSMTSDIADKYFSIGESKTPDGMNELGNYGAGAKTSAFSMANKVTLYTKTPLGVLERRTQTIEMACNGYEVEVTDENDTDIVIGEDEKEFFYSKIGNKEHGTLIVISDLIDGVMPKSWITGTTTEYKKAYSKFLLKNPNKTLKINGKTVYPLNYFGGYTNGGNKNHDNFDAEKLEDGVIHIKGCEVKWASYYLKRDSVHTDESYDIGISPHNSGLWIFRNDRCVGFGVKVGGICGVGDGHMNMMRVEIDITGDADKIFGSMFNKMIKDDKGIDNEFKDRLKAAIEPSKKRINSEYNKDRTKEGEERDNEILEYMNLEVEKSRLHNKRDKTQNTTNDNDDNDVDKETNQNKPSKKYHPKLYGSFITTYNLSERDNLLSHELKEGKYHVTLNGNHRYYTNFLSSLDTRELGSFINYAMSERIGIDKYSEAIDDEIGNGDGKLVTLMSRSLEFIEDARERCLHAMYDKQPDLSFFNEDDVVKSIRSSKNCVGVGVSSEELGIETMSEKEMEFATAAS